MSTISAAIYLSSTIFLIQIKKKKLGRHGRRMIIQHLNDEENKIKIKKHGKTS